MTNANWCIAIACLIPPVMAVIPKSKSMLEGQNAVGGAYDNDRPREWSARQKGWKQRTLAAHENGYEALPLFIAAIILAQMAHADQALIDLLAMVFIGIRIVYAVLYVADKGWWRTAAWIAGVADCLCILALS